MKLRNVITEEICEAEAREDGIYIKANWSDEEKWFRYDLETLARGWDYYVEPAEPLIKDEKVRKAVRAWADVLEVDKVEFYGSETWIGLMAKNAGTGWSSKFELDYLGSENTLIPFRTYTIAELCGEEE